MEKKFVRRPPSAPAREAPQRWRVQKCQRHHSSPRAPAPRRSKVRMEPVLPSVAALCSGGRGPAGVPQLTGLGRGKASRLWTSGKPGVGGGRSRAPSSAHLPAWPGYCPAAGSVEPRFRRDSLFCPDELDSLFSYFDAGAAAAGPRSKSPAAHPPAQPGQQSRDRACLLRGWTSTGQLWPLTQGPEGWAFLAEGTSVGMGRVWGPSRAKAGTVSPRAGGNSATDLEP